MISSSGKQVVPSSGPIDAEIIMVAESPARHEVELGAPLVGKSGKMLDQALVKAGIDRSKLRLVNLIPVRPNHDRFEEHLESDVRWAKDQFALELRRLKKAKV